MGMPEIIGTIPQWLTFGAVTTFAGLLLKHRLGWRGQTLKAEEDMRDHYALEVEALRKQRLDDAEKFTKVEKHLREMIGESDRRHEECEVARRELRKELDVMHNELTGLKRQIIRYSAHKVAVMEGNGHAPSEDVVEAAKRVTKITEEPDDEEK